MTYFVERGPLAKIWLLSNWWPVTRAEKCSNVNTFHGKNPVISAGLQASLLGRCPSKYRPCLSLQPLGPNGTLQPRSEQWSSLRSMASLCPSPLVGGCGPKRRFPHLWKPTVSGRRLQCEGLFCSGEKDTLFITFENQFLKISLISNIMCVWERKNRPGVTSLLWFKKSFS